MVNGFIALGVAYQTPEKMRQLPQVYKGEK